MSDDTDLTEAIADAIFHDVRLWYRFTDNYEHLGGPGDARREIAAVAARVSDATIDALRDELEQMTTYRDNASLRLEMVTRELDEARAGLQQSSVTAVSMAGRLGKAVARISVIRDQALLAIEDSGIDVPAHDPTEWKAKGAL